MKITKFKSILVILISSFVLQFCSETDNDPEEFIADASDFFNFMNFNLEASNIGADPALGTAHAGNDSTVTRKVYIKNGQNTVNGSYPLGTIIVKHSKKDDNTVNEITAMVKRGNDFNSDVGNWEWFMLNPADNSIVVRGGKEMMNGMCNACHSAASAKDYVFSN